MQLARRSFDLFTGYSPSKPMTEASWLTRMLFLETVAELFEVPGGGGEGGRAGAAQGRVV